MALFDNSLFNPQSYNGTMDGWLQQALRSGLLGNAAPAMGPQIGPTYAKGDQGMMGGVPFPIAPGPEQQTNPQAIPPNAQPAGPAPGMPPQAAPQMQPPPLFGPQASPDVFSRLSAAVHNIGGKGIIPGIFDATQGLATGQRVDPQGMQQQQLQATYQALVKSGVPPAMAQAAALNPEILKTIGPAFFDTKPTLQDAGTDPLTGEKKFVWAQPNKMTITQANPVAPGGSPAVPGGPQGSLTGFNDAINRGISGEALYDYVPPAMKETVKAMIEGRKSPPTQAAMRSPQVMALINMAHTIDPSFDETNWGARAASQKDFASGKSSEMVRAANQVVHHIGDKLLKSVDELDNTQSDYLNAAGNFVSQRMGEPYVNNFKLAAHSIATEMSRVFKGANLSDREVWEWERSLDPNMSPTQLKGAVGTLMTLLDGSLQALNDKRERGIGIMAHAKAPPIISPDTQKVIDRINAWTSGAPKEAAAPPANTKAPVVDPVEAEMRRRGLLK